MSFPDSNFGWDDDECRPQHKPGTTAAAIVWRVLIVGIVLAAAATVFG